MEGDERKLVEAPALEQLKGLGWSHLDGTTLVPEKSNHRSSLKDVVITPNLEQAIQRINPWISEDNLRKVVREVTLIQTSTLMEANQWFWERLTQYFSVDQDLGSGRRGQTLKLIDFDNLENNEFLCVDQFKIQGPSQNIIPDILLFVNGLPLGVIECKSPFVTDPMAEGINQLRRYANLRNPSDTEGCEKLFHYNQVMISTHRDGARVGTISSPVEYYLEWKDPYPTDAKELGSPANAQQLLIQGLLKPQNFLDIIQNFTLYETESGRTIKKIARYQQFRAVQKTIERLRAPGDRKSKGGVIWHTQGSGKSLTMVFLTQKIRRDPLLRDYKLVFLTDRTQLDGQLTATFRNAQGESVLNASSVSHLKELLARDASDLVTATIQKLQEGDFGFTCLNDSDRIIVLADEAHRTQYGTLGSAINTALPNAPKIAFTGTPLITSEKTTQEFGGYIDTYTIEQAVADGATCQILYEGREATTKVTGDSLDALFDRYFQDKTPEEKTAIKKKYGTEKAVLEAPQRVEWVGLDLVQHYRTTILPNGFKGILVTGSREVAVLYKQKLDAIPGAPESAVVISGDHNDPPHLAKWTNPADHKKAIENFKKPIHEHPLSLLIVKDMLLTGFDAPICQVMYLDRKLTDHTLLQAIARVNRTKANKHCGYIVDYYGLTDYLAEALQVFSSTDVQGALKNLKDEIPKLQSAHTRVKQHLKGLDLQDIDSCIEAMQDELKRQQFEADFRTFAKQVEIVLPDPSANPFLPDLKALGKVVIGCRNRYRDEQLNLVGCGEKVRALIEENVRATGVDPRVPPTKLFDVEFEQVLAAQTNDRAKASEVEHAIKAHLKVKLDDDPEYYQSLSLRLEEIIQKYQNKWEELVQQLLLFRDGMEREKSQQNEDLGLSETEGAFYRSLMKAVTSTTEVDALDEETHQRVLDLTKELVGEFQEATQIIGFFDKWDEVARIKRQIKRSILDQPFGDKDLVDAVTERFMELGKRHFR
ncbi:type I restriction endonuclease subunit R [Cyanobium sp. Alchichica 3B3-8F6]|uniref:type I restriction endonuclease subunit R n=1 Tax=Cyanobium sp. Alchichica 3B3-8F6 TaxID=2823696 RepID=UPI0020CB97AD|nr:type I restriction endonuclease subunit R [Cyanobium sp. Alchichica 3B3-8F6]MCP9882829.1 type I restriction endonuclease subunit R [Cyanobium sp. Alchichica 3B3-8F6]